MNNLPGTALTVVPRLKSLIRPLSEFELARLEENIVRDGCREPLSVWVNGEQTILLDGHNRYAICTKHNLPFKTAAVDSITLDGYVVPIDSIERAELWLGQNQNGRRNLDANDRAVLAAQLVPAFTVEAQRRQVEGKTLAHSCAKGTGKASTQAAKLIGTGTRYVEAVTKAAGYNTKTQSFAKPEVLTQIGSGAGQLKIADIVRQQRQEKQQAKLAEITRENANKLPEDKIYTVIYVDCPWRYDHPISDSRKIENHYETMTDEELEAFTVSFESGAVKPVGDIAANDSVMFFCATAPKLKEALRVIEAWGFEYKTHIIWDKEMIGMGNWVRGQHELLMIATKGNMPTPPRSIRVPSVVRSPRGKHSEKPDVFYEIIERMYPNASKVELFARSERAGWNSTGNQLEVSLPAAA